MNSIAGARSGLTWAVHLSLLAMVLLWLFPTVGLLVSSFRTADQIATSGWWKSMVPSQQNLTLRTGAAAEQSEQNGVFVVEGNLFDGRGAGDISVWGISSRDISAFQPGATAELRNGGSLSVQRNGDYRMENSEPFGRRGQRVFVTATSPPEFSASYAVSFPELVPAS